VECRRKLAEFGDRRGSAALQARSNALRHHRSLWRNLRVVRKKCILSVLFPNSRTSWAVKSPTAGGAAGAGATASAAGVSFATIFDRFTIVARGCFCWVFEIEIPKNA
jgi:hypothetical protein